MKLTGRRAERRAGLTIIEVVISSTILALIALAVGYATLPLSRASSEITILMDMDRTAANILDQVRRELRQSGWDGTVAAEPAMFGETALDDDGLDDGGTQILFQRREGPTTWSSSITYRRTTASPSVYTGVPGTINRYKVERVQNGLVTTIGEDVSNLTFARPAAGDTITVTLELTRPNPNWSGTTPPPAITKTYVDKVQFMNRNPN